MLLLLIMMRWPAAGLTYVKCVGDEQHPSGRASRWGGQLGADPRHDRGRSSSRSHPSVCDRRGFKVSYDDGDMAFDPDVLFRERATGGEMRPRSVATHL
jgi:hypothetical protein